jgi:hypothetical protein
MCSFFLQHNQQIKEVIASATSFMHSKENEVKSLVVDSGIREGFENRPFRISTHSFEFGILTLG